MEEKFMKEALKEARKAFDKDEVPVGAVIVKDGKIPVINALSDMYHPCQALADYMTIKELTKKDWKDIQVGYIGEPNNVSNSLLPVVIRTNLFLFSRNILLG